MEKTTTICRGDDVEDLLLPLDKEADLIQEILVRLPIKSLLRFKSVSKSWFALIQSPFFIHLHTTFNSSSSSKLGGTFILQALPFTEDGDGYICTKFTGGGGGGGGDWHWDNTNCVRYWVSDGRDRLWDETNDRWYLVGDDQEELFKADDDDQLLLKLDNLELPSCYKLTYRNYIQGSCNGLLCLYDFKECVVSLGNPATRQSRILPKPITIEKEMDSDVVLFGFDVKTKDYKVVQMRGNLLDYSCRVQVYSLSTDSWRLLEGINSLPTPISNGLYLNGSCFFVARTKNGLIINSFDFTKEIFTTMQLPPDHDDRHYLFLRCLGGEKMALFTTLRTRLSDNDDVVCHIYEHGSGVNKESWTKLHSFQIKNARYVTPRGISNNGKFALLQTTDTFYSNRMQLYNLITKEKKFDIPLCGNVSNVYAYKPSLVSIIGGNGVAAASCDRLVIGGAM